jgi:hypothetical protein
LAAPDAGDGAGDHAAAEYALRQIVAENPRNPDDEILAPNRALAALATCTSGRDVSGIRRIPPSQRAGGNTRCGAFGLRSPA